MQVKHKNFLMMGVLISLVLTIELVQPIAAREDPFISKGSTITYNTSSTAAYRMYTGTTRITITDNETYPMQGYMETSIGDDKWGYQSNNVTLLPFIVNTTWAKGIENCPLLGHNDTRSPIIENWVESKLTFDIEGEAYGDLGRTVNQLEFSYDYTVVNRDSNTTYDNVSAQCIYKWDSNLGVLLMSIITITNLNDSSLDGQINMTLSETSLWGLSADSKIPGYPIEITGTLILLTLGGLLIFFNNKRRGLLKNGGI